MREVRVQLDMSEEAVRRLLANCQRVPAQQNQPGKPDRWV